MKLNISVYFKNHKIKILIFICLIIINILLSIIWINSKKNNVTNLNIHYKNNEVFISDKLLSHQFNIYKEIITNLLSILQNYYVDQDKVTPAYLIKSIFINLNTYPNITVNIDKSSNRYELYVNKKHKSFTIHENINLYKLQTLITEISIFIQNILYSQTKNNIYNLDEETKFYQGLYLVLNSLLSSLDPHSNILNKYDYKDLLDGTQGIFGGIGLLVTIRDGILTVINPLPNSPAIKAGIKANDKIIKINDIDTFGLSLDTLIKYMRGEPGTEIYLSLLRDTDIAPRRLAITRELIEVNSLTNKIIYTNSNQPILYLKLENFTNTTTNEIYQTFIKFQKQYPKSNAGIILDLRNNPGGLLEQAIKVANLFIEEGMIVGIKGKKPIEEHAYKDNLSKINLPLIVLINKNSASASEIVAAALQENKRALIIGQPSFGKGSVQTVFELPYEQGVKLTVARYYTPTKRSLQNIGVIPDIILYPVYQKSKNYNLLGNYKYKKEAYLKNHLTSITEEKNNNTSKYLNTNFEYSSFITGYYLVPQETELINIDEAIKSEETKLATIILSELYNTYQGTIPTYGQRSYHWLTLASKKINKYINELNEKTANWLQNTHQIDWSSTNEKELFLINKNSFINFKIHSATNNLTIGDKFKIKWTIQNTSEFSIDRLAVSAFSSIPSINSSEILIGKLDPNATISGVIKFDVPTTFLEQYLKLHIGVSQNNNLIESTINTVNITINPNTPPSLSLNLEFKDENKTKDNLLEDYEKVIAQLEIINTSNIVFKAAKLKFINLSGNQLLLNSKEFYINQIEKQTPIYIQIPIEANKLISNTLNIGVTISAENTGYEFKKMLTIQNKNHIPTLGIFAH